MATFTLDEDEVEAIFLALKGERNLDTLTKLKDKLELAQMHAGVREVEGMLRVLQGTGIQQPGLLRMFNAQHDALADAGSEQRHQEALKPARARKKKGERDDTAPIPFPNAESPESPAAAAPADGPQWAEGTPSPRPAKGQRLVWPSGEALELTDVLGYDPEANGFRVVASNGWDGMVYSYGKAEHQEWRVLTMAMQYADENSPEKEPLGEGPTALAEARRLAHQLEQLGSSGEMSRPQIQEEYLRQAQELLRYTLWLLPTDQEEAIREGFHKVAQLETVEERPRVLARTVLYNLEAQHGVEEPAGASLEDLETAEAQLAVGEIPEGASSGDGEIAGTERAQELADAVREELAGETLGTVQDEQGERLEEEMVRATAGEPEPVVVEEEPANGKRGGRGGQRARNAAQAGVATRGRKKK